MPTTSAGISFETRVISPQDFGVLIADLRLAPTIFQERLLEFLEQQNIVLPVARVRWPISLVIEAREGVIYSRTPTRSNCAQIGAIS